MSGTHIVSVVIDRTNPFVIQGQYIWQRAAGATEGVLVPPHGSAFPTATVADEWFWRDDLQILYKRNAANTAWDAITAAPVAHASTHAPITGSDPLAFAAPVAIADLANASGSADSYALSDHVHAHGARGGGTLHALASAVLNGFMSAADFAKLLGIAAGAEVNAVDSVFGRTGAVIAALSDYDASQVDNDSTVTGATVANALDTLLGLIPGAAPVDSVFGRTGAVVAVASDYDADQVDYDNSGSGLTATDVQAAIDEVAASGGAVDSVFGRTGAVVAVASDYDADQVDYDDTSIDLLDSAGTAVTDVQAAIDAIALPQRIGIAESPGVSTVVGTLVFQDKIVRVFPSAVTPAGTYQLRISYGWNYDNESFDFLGKILDNGVQVGLLHQQEPKDAQNATGGIPGTGTDQAHYLYRSLQLTYVSQVAHTYTLQWATNNISHEASIWEARLELWRDA